MDRLHGTFAERVAVPACQLYPLSESLPEEEAVLIEPLAVLLHAFRISQPEAVESVAIVGRGTDRLPRPRPRPASGPGPRSR